jgi:hypothetical protein
MTQSEEGDCGVADEDCGVTGFWESGKRRKAIKRALNGLSFMSALHTRTLAQAGKAFL